MASFEEMRQFMHNDVHRAAKSDSAMREMRNWQREFPELISPLIQVRKIEVEIVEVNPFTTEQATVGKFRDAFPGAPEEHLDILRLYFKEGFSMRLDD